MSEMMTEGEEEEVFALQFAEALLGSDAVARGIPSMDDIADDQHFSVYWRSAAGSSVAKNDPNAFRQCLYVDITIEFQQKTTLPDRNAVAVNVQFGSFWKEQQQPSPTLQPQNEKKDEIYRYVVLRADPSSSATDHRHAWFAQLRRKHWQSPLGIDVAATPGPVLAQLWGRAWREWTPEHAAWNHDGGPCVYLQYPPEFARSRVPFPFFDETAGEKTTTDPSLTSPVHLECEMVPVQMAQSILLQHRQSSRMWPPTSDAATANLSTPVTSKSLCCWDVYQQWKHRTSHPIISAPPAASVGITATELPQHTPTMVATAADAPERPPCTEAAPKRRRIVRPNAPRRVPMASTRPPGHRFV